VRRIRISAGLMVQTMVMALLGPAPAVAIGADSTAYEARLHRVPLFLAISNVIVFALLGLGGGSLFDVLRRALDVDRHDTAYAMLAFPAYLLLAAINLVLIAAVRSDLPVRRRILRETGVPMIPLELATGMLAAASVLIWSELGLGAAVALVLAVAVSIPLSRTLAEALTTGDDLVAMQQVSDERTAEVARLSSDRDRLLTEVLGAEGRERARLAESLHDGPMQRLMAIRQDVVEGRARAADLDRAIAETRSIISAFHPATVRELGFEASLRAAVAAFPAAQSICLTVRSTEDSELLLPIAQELVVNAVKHATPSTIDVAVGAHEGQLVL
jgi:two-component system NarL family sensor kinase